MNRKKAEIAISILEQLEFKAKSIEQDKPRLYWVKSILKI